MNTTEPMETIEDRIKKLEIENVETSNILYELQNDIDDLKHDFPSISAKPKMNHSKYCIEQLINFLHDSLDEEGLEAEEIYDNLVDALVENYVSHSRDLQKIQKLLKLFGHNVEEPVETAEISKKDRTTSWVLPVEEVRDDDTDEIIYCITLPQDLLGEVGWVEGDLVEFVDLENGAWKVSKYNKPFTPQGCWGNCKA